AKIVQPRDVDPLSHELGELLRRLRVAGRELERQRQRPEAPRLLGHGVPRRFLAGPGGGRAVPRHAPGDAVLDELEAAFRYALEVERLRQATGAERIVGDRDPLVEDPLSEPPGQVAPALEQAEPV